MGVGHNFSQNVIFEAISVLSANRSPASVPGRRQGYPWVVETSWRSITRGTASKNCFFTRFLVRGGQIPFLVMNCAHVSGTANILPK